MQLGPLNKRQRAGGADCPCSSTETKRFVFCSSEVLASQAPPSQIPQASQRTLRAHRPWRILSDRIDLHPHGVDPKGSKDHTGGGRAPTLPAEGSKVGAWLSTLSSFVFPPLPFPSPRVFRDSPRPLSKAGCARQSATSTTGDSLTRQGKQTPGRSTGPVSLLPYPHPLQSPLCRIPL